MRSLIASPLNYTGGKFKLLPQLLPLFPKKINTFIDLFCGGANVGINVKSHKVIYNDISPQLHELYKIFSTQKPEILLSSVYKIIDKYNLSLSSKNGYEFYKSTSNKGLGEYNKNGFLRLRNELNDKNIIDEAYCIMLYVAIVYAFNNQIRFNANGEFNLPVGKRDFNAKMQEKLLRFMTRLQEQSREFSCLDFRNFDTKRLGEDDFVYIDPPYLITCASYNENGGWSEKDELDLLKFIDNLDKKGIKFAISNVLTSKGKTNKILLSWLEKRQFSTHHLRHKYSNSNYQIKDKSGFSDEVLITNY